MQFYVYLTPKSSENHIEDWVSIPPHEKILKVKVRAAPEKNNANKALILLLSRKLKVPKRDIQILRGATSKIKLVAIVGITEEHLKF